MFGKVSFITCATAYPRNTRYRRRVRLEWVRYPDRVPTGLLRAVQCRAGGSEQSLRVIRHWIVRRGDTRRCADLKQVALPEYRGGKTGDLPSDDPFQRRDRSEEHTSELQSLMRISYAVFCLKKKKIFMQKTDTVTDAFKVQPIQTHIITFMRASIKTNTVLTIHSLV